ncbi:MAG: hypothetical protein ACTSRK_14000 [Promethearchaeota archaeon]
MEFLYLSEGMNNGPSLNDLQGNCKRKFKRKRKVDLLSSPPMTIEIDDSGTGDIVGPAFILFWRRETNTLVTKEVPLELYQQKEFNALTKTYIRDLFISTFQEMDIPPTEDIHLCTGPCFDDARVWLKENSYNYQDAKIEGYLQTQVEGTYLNYIIEEYNFPPNKASIESGKKRFFAIYNWLVKDFPRRSLFVKSGFEKWQTKWKPEAEHAWMKNMVTPKPSYYSSQRRKRFPPSSKKESSDRTPHSPNSKQKGKSSGKGGSKAPKGKSAKKGKRKYNPRKKQSREPKYSSTDPDPKQKFF